MKDDWKRTTRNEKERKTFVAFSRAIGKTKMETKRMKQDDKIHVIVDLLHPPQLRIDSLRWVTVEIISRSWSCVWKGVKSILRGNEKSKIENDVEVE